MIVAALVLLFMNLILPNQAEYPPLEVKAGLAKLHEICLNKLGLADDISKNYDFSNKSPEIMCYMKCLMVEGGWGTDDEVILYDRIIDEAHPEIKPIVENMMKRCRDIPAGNQDCEKTYNLFACAHDVDPEHFYMP